MVVSKYEKGKKSHPQFHKAAWVESCPLGFILIPRFSSLFLLGKKTSWKMCSQRRKIYVEHVCHACINGTSSFFSFSFFLSFHTRNLAWGLLLIPHISFSYMNSLHKAQCWKLCLNNSGVNAPAHNIWLIILSFSSSA